MKITLSELRKIVEQETFKINELSPNQPPAQQTDAAVAAPQRMQQQNVQDNAETNASVGQVRATMSSAKQQIVGLQDKLRKTRNAQATSIALRVNRKIDEVMRDLDELTKTFT